MQSNEDAALSYQPIQYLFVILQQYKCVTVY